MTDCQRRPRVILWGPGQVGVGALRALIAHPGLDMVGVVVHAKAKEGRDAGDLCGMSVTGVIATRDVDAALALDADVVAYFASGDYRYHEAAEVLDIPVGTVRSRVARARSRLLELERSGDVRSG